jgi:hypothetical protein
MTIRRKILQKVQTKSCRIYSAKLASTGFLLFKQLASGNFTPPSRTASGFAGCCYDLARRGELFTTGIGITIRRLADTSAVIRLGWRVGSILTAMYWVIRFHILTRLAWQIVALGLVHPYRRTIQMLKFVLDCHTFILTVPITIGGFAKAMIAVG